MYNLFISIKRFIETVESKNDLFHAYINSNKMVKTVNFAKGD